jgi:hypothetical protein
MIRFLAISSIDDCGQETPDKALSGSFGRGCLHLGSLALLLERGRDKRYRVCVN